MSIITTTKATERLSRKLQRAGIDCWIGVSSGDSAGKYLVFRVGGRCICGAGWTLSEAEDKVDQMIYLHTNRNTDPFFRTGSYVFSHEER